MIKKIKIVSGKIFYNIFALLFHKRINMSRDKCEDVLENYYEDAGTSIYCQESDCTYGFDLHVIVPCYNVENYVEQCVDSIVSQKTKYKIFVTLVNDGSSDKTLDIIEKYAKYKNVSIINQSNKGLSGARNAGLKKIFGNYVMFVDSDDYLLPNSIDKLMDCAYRKNYDIVEGGCQRLTSDNKIINHFIYKNIEEVSPFSLSGYSCMKVYKSSLFNKIRFPEKYWFEDSINLLAIYPIANRACVIDSAVYVYRVVMSSITHSVSNNPKTLDTFYVTNAIVKEWGKLNIKSDKSLLDAFLLQCHINCLRLCKHPLEVQKAVFMKQFELLHFNFKGLKPSRKYIKIYKSLLKNDFSQYIFWCKTHR